MAEIEYDPNVTGMVLYTDGGAYQDRKLGGMGVHGYHYKLVEPKHGAGLQGYILTDKGYQVKGVDDDAKGLVPPTFYIDWCGCQLDGATNNTAELAAFIKALEIAVEQDVQRVSITSDSEYVLKGVDRLDTYRGNGWKKQDGQVLKNVELWQALDKQWVVLKERNVQVDIQWTKGHNGEPGNVKADTLATIGLAYATAKKATPEPTQSEPSGYWKSSGDYNRLFGTHYAVFLPGSPVTETTDAKRYYLYADMSPQASVETFGTASPNASYAIVDSKEPQVLLDNVVASQAKLADTRANPVMMARIGNVYSKDTASLIADFSDMAVVEDENGLHVAGKKIADLFHVSYNAMHGLSYFSALEAVFDNYEKTPAVFQIKDITAQLFTTTVTPADKKKPEKVVTKFTPEDDAPFLRFQLPDDPYGRQITLVYGMGLPPLNSLKAAAKANPKVELVLTDEGNGVLRYYAVVSTDEGKGIWHNPFMCSLLPVKPREKKR